MKRILLITENLGSGGAERQICGLAVLLTKAGYPCKLVTYIQNQFYEPYLRKNGVDYELVTSLWNKKTRVFRSVRYIREYNPDVVISFLPSVNQTMCLAKLFHKGKLIVSERNNNISISLYDRLTFNLYRFADAIVPNSNSQGEFIKHNFPFLSRKVYPIINFVDLDRFCPSDKEHINEVLRIITVARYAPQKNLFVYLKAVRKAKERGLKIHFDWFGDKKYNPTYYKQVEEEYERLDIKDYLILHDTLQSIEKEYQKSDIFLLPSLYEGYPNVVVEAMSCGLPVICSNRYENPYIVKNGVNGYLFNPESADDIAEAIVKIISLSEPDRRQMGAKNRMLCLTRNSTESFIKSYINLIEKL